MSILNVKSGRINTSYLFRWFNQATGWLKLILKRQRYHIGITLLALLGIVLAVGMITNASFFSQAVYRAILNQELSDFALSTGRPAFSTSVYFFPSQRVPVSLEKAENLSRQFSNILAGKVGLPTRQTGLQVSSGGMMLQPETDSALYAAGKNYLGDVQVVYVAGAADHIVVSDGKVFNEEDSSNPVLEVWMHERLAQEMGVHVGERFKIGVTIVDNQVPILLAGFWHAKDPQANYWFTNPDIGLKDALLVRRQDYIKFIQPKIASGSREADWFITLDERKVLPQNGSSYIDGFTSGLALIDKTLPGARLNSAPLVPLENFVQRSNTLMVLLLSYNLPAFGILLYFLVITSTIIARWQRKDTSILVSRGMSVPNVVNMVFIEQMLLFILGLPLGILFGMFLALMMGYSNGFLSFTPRAPLPVSLDGLSFPLAILAMAFYLLARLIPSFQVARQSLVTEEREWARPVDHPVIYRYYLDLILIIPTYYAYDQMVKHGSLAGLIVSKPQDLFNDPVLILVPALFILTVALVIMRLFPLIMSLIDSLASLTPWLTLHLALRQLGRQSQDYLRPLLLVIVSLALGVYTLSMAASLDKWLVERVYYKFGADMVLTPMPLIQGTVFTDGYWIPAASEFSKLPGVAGATRVGNYFAIIKPNPDTEEDGRFLAIDRLDFPSVAWYRSDFSQESLGALMNRLALSQDGVLVSQDFLARNKLGIGDLITVRVSIDQNTNAQSEFTIAGAYQYFPTAYEDQEGVTIIGDLDSLSNLFNYTVPHDIWLKLKPGADGKAVLKAIPGKLGISYAKETDTTVYLMAEQARMERAGIFGTLTIGFLATAAMAILGLLLYSYASLRQRVYQFAVLHAQGVSRRQIIVQVVMEYTFLAVFGVMVGAAVGRYASDLFVPFFRFTGEVGIPLPPLIPIIANQEVWNLTITFTLVIILAEIGAITAALRQRLALLLK